MPITLFTKRKTEPDLQSGRLAGIYAYYRIALALVFIFLFIATYTNPIIGAESPKFYALTLLGYFFFSMLAHIGLKTNPHSLQWQMFVGLVVDVFALTMMLYANGGPNIQVSMLYLVTVVAAFIILTQKQAMFITLFAVICVVYQQFFYALTKQVDARGFSNVTLLSLSFIGVGLLSHLVAGRLRSVESLAVSQASEVGKLSMLNQQIIERMDSGVVVVDSDFKITLCNKAAQRILGLSSTRPQREFTSVDDLLAQQIKHTLAIQKSQLLFNEPASHIQEALAITIHHLPDDLLLLIIERISRSQQQAQQMKLASLGRLTASIAHEIRNPIGAISQASQLLAEDDADPNTPIYQIIHKQTQRVNQIIEDVLKLSRNNQGELDDMLLDVFIPKFIAEHFADQDIVCHVATGLSIRFNSSQLEQVLLNLVQNALIHGAQRDEETHKIIDNHVKIIASLEQEQVIIDIIDNGDGVDTTNQASLFEPFFTTKSSGTGLGLYLSRAFCEANGASLNYLPNHQGACFRIAKNNQPTQNTAKPIHFV